MGFKKKEKVDQVVLENFIITKKVDGFLGLRTKTGDWNLELSGESNFGVMINFFMNSNTKEEINELLTRVYYTSITMITDIELAGIIGNYFEARLNKALDESGDEKKDLEIVKEITDAGKEEKS